ncbi:MAG: competence/damage-inducible protein A [Bdellovibrionales bacterium]
MNKTALLVIGDEILTGRTQDANTHYLATELARLGLPLAEVRVVPDDMDEIVAALNALRKKYKYVFTTGGIGPTHDDITADAVAQAFGVDLPIHPEALARLEAYYENRPGKVNEARRRMARVPVGGQLIENTVTSAPGFYIENVFVLAGVPHVMQAMFGALKPLLEPGAPLISYSVLCRIAEGDLSASFEAIAKKYPAVSLGSYPHQIGDNKWEVTLVARGYDAALVKQAYEDVQQMIIRLGGEADMVSLGS